jgi:hypothetical protein
VCAELRKHVDYLIKLSLYQCSAHPHTVARRWGLAFWLDPVRYTRDDSTLTPTLTARPSGWRIDN